MINKVIFRDGEPGSECPFCGQEPPARLPWQGKDLVVDANEELALRVAEVLTEDSPYQIPSRSPQECLDAAGLGLVVEDHGWHLWVRRADAADVR